MNNFKTVGILLFEEAPTTVPDEVELQRRVKEREKHYAAGAGLETAVSAAPTIGIVGAGAAIASGASLTAIALMAIPYLIAAALLVAISSGISAGIAWLIARMTRKGYKKSQIQKAVAVLQHKAEEKGLKESKLMTESVINAMIDGYTRKE